MRRASNQIATLAWLVMVLAFALGGCRRSLDRNAGGERESQTTSAPREVVFWHFWGGEDGLVVEDVVARFNASQSKHVVRAVAMPGNNLDLKLFLAIAGGDPPDLVNQDDPIVADWAVRDAILPLDRIAPAEELKQLESFLLPSARRLGQYQGRRFAVCNGLDVRALYFNRTMLQAYGLEAPRSLADLDRIATTIAPPDQDRYERVGYLPDSRRLWAWGAVFGGDFYDESQQQPTLDDPRIVAALEWMTGYRERYGADALQAFRQGDQSLPGSAFPLLPYDDSMQGRYAVLMDGQWRTRDIAAAVKERQRQGLPIPEFGVCPLPPPPAGLSDAGWVNGNFFVCPRGARNPEGAWAFMKFWCGLDGHQAAAAKTCAAGGWIPVSQEVIDQPEFQAFLKRQPLFQEFVRLAGSENQFPTPVVPGAAQMDREVKLVGAVALSDDDSPPPQQLLKQANDRLIRRLRERLDD